MQPISVIFTLPEHYLHPVSQEMAAGPLTVFAQARSDARATETDLRPSAEN
jgi:hypothetical protein